MTTPPPILRGLCLDLDGTLADTLALCVRSFQDVLEQRRGRRPPAAEVTAWFGVNEEGILARLFGSRDLEVEESWHARYAELLAAEVPAPFPGVRELIADVAARGVRIAVVTGKGLRSARHTLDHLGLLRHVERIEPGGPDGCVKTARLAAILADWHLPAAQVAHVGDTAMDLRAARDNGICAVAAAWASTTDPARLAAEASDVLFTDIAEFAAWLRNRLPAP